MLLLHGLAGSNLYFGAAFDALARDGGVVVPDLLGFGSSPKPEESDYGLEAHARALDGALEELGVSRPLVVAAHSFGTLVALQLALTRPRRVSSIVAFGPPLYATEAAARELFVRLGWPTRVFASDGWLAHAMCRWMCRHREAAGTLFTWIRGDLPAEVARAASLHTWASYSRTLANAILRDGPKLPLDRLAARTTLVQGTDDRVVDAGYLESIAASHPMVELRRLVGAHDLPIADPVTCLRLIRQELRALRPG